MSEKISRRKFLGYSGAVAAGLAAAACGPATTPAPAQPTTAPAAPVAPTSAPAAPPAAPVAPTSAPAAPPAAVVQPTARPVANIDWWTVANTPETGGNQAATEKMLAEFNKAVPWVKVKPTFLADDGYSEKMTTVMGSGVGVPDMATVNVADWFPAATDLREMIEKDKIDIKQYSKIHFDSRCLYNNKIIGLPTAVGATMYFYNTKLLDEKGIKYPEWGYTLEQMLNDAVKISDRSKKIFGATMQTRIWRAEMFAFGARPFDDEGKKVDGFMNGPKTVKAFEFFYDLAQSGAVPTPAEFEVLRTEGTGPIDLFNTGRLAFAPLNNGQFQIVDKAGVKFGLIHNPTVTGEEVITNGWALQMGIPTASKNKEAAWEWIKWYTGVEGQRYLTKLNVGFTSAIPTLWKEDPAQQDPRVKFFGKILETRQVWEFAGRFPYFTKVTRLNQDLYDRIYQNKVKRSDIKGELDKTVAEAQKIVDEERKKLGWS